MANHTAEILHTAPQSMNVDYLPTNRLKKSRVDSFTLEGADFHNSAPAVAAVIPETAHAAYLRGVHKPARLRRQKGIFGKSSFVSS